MEAEVVDEPMEPSTSTAVPVPVPLPTPNPVKVKEPEPVALLDDKFFLEEAERLRSTDPAAAKCHIITAKCLFPDKHQIHLAAYHMEKEEDDPQQAANCFSYICTTFPNTETWEEFSEMLNTLQMSESDLTTEHEFYIRMFPHISCDVQQKLILFGLKDTGKESIFSKSKLLLMTFKRFPQVARNHSCHLLELLTDGAMQNQPKCQELLVEEALPLYYDNPPDLKPSLVFRIFTLSLEHCLQKIVKEDPKRELSDNWRKIYKILSFCSKILRWDTFPTFRKTLPLKYYWDTFLLFIASNKADNTHILFHGTTFFFYCLNLYIRNLNVRVEDGDADHVFVEGFTDWMEEEPSPMGVLPKISFPTVHNEMITEAFVYAAKCWPLLNNDPFARDFNKLILSMPVKTWMAHFLFDLSCYFGQKKEVTNLLAEVSNKNRLIYYVHQLSLSILSGELTLETFEFILKILNDLPAVQGKDLDCLTINEPRHVIFFPLAQKPLVQYCAKALVKALKPKLLAPNCSNQLLGDVLILSQMEYPYDSDIPELIFATIMAKKSFIYHKLLDYLTVPDFVEEFYYITNSQNEDFTLEITRTPTSMMPTTIIHSPEEPLLVPMYIAEPESPPLEDQGIPVIKRPDSTTHELLQPELQQQSSTLEIFPIQKDEIMESPSIEQNLVEQPLIAQPLMEQPLIEQPLMEPPLIDQPLAEPSLIDQPMMEPQSLIDQPLIEQPMLDQAQSDNSSQAMGTLDETKISGTSLSLCSQTPMSRSSRASPCSERSETHNFRSIFKQQILRANENLANIVANFIVQEQESIIQDLFGAPSDTETL